jgi:hypothetical protein
MVTVMAAMPEKLLEAVSKSCPVFFLLLNDLLDLEEVVVVVDLLFAQLAETELGTGGAFVPDADDGFGQAPLALDSFVNQSNGLNLLGFVVEDLLLKARNQGLHSLIN